MTKLSCLQLCRVCCLCCMLRTPGSIKTVPLAYIRRKVCLSSAWLGCISFAKPRPFSTYEELRVACEEGTLSENSSKKFTYVVLCSTVNFIALVKTQKLK